MTILKVVAFIRAEKDLWNFSKFWQLWSPIILCVFHQLTVSSHQLPYPFQYNLGYPLSGKGLMNPQIFSTAPFRLFLRCSTSPERIFVSHNVYVISFSITFHFFTHFSFDIQISNPFSCLSFPSIFPPSLSICAYLIGVDRFSYRSVQTPLRSFEQE